MVRRTGVHRIVSIGLLLVSSISAGMSSDGCSTTVPGVTPRSAPDVTAEVTPENAHVVTLLVDLKQYPDARTVNWDFGDGAIAANLPADSGSALTHTFVSGGTFTVQAYAFDNVKRQIANGSVQVTIPS